MVKAAARLGNFGFRNWEADEVDETGFMAHFPIPNNQLPNHQSLIPSFHSRRVEW